MTQALAQMGAGDNTALDLLIDLAEGSVGAAAELLASDGLQVLEHLQELLAGAPGLDRNRMNSFVARFEGRDPEFHPRIRAQDFGSDGIEAGAALRPECSGLHRWSGCRGGTAEKTLEGTAFRTHLG